MADVVNLKTVRKDRRKDRARGRTLCARGFHKWVIDHNKQFDVKQGRLVTVSRCSRCGETKTTAT